MAHIERKSIGRRPLERVWPLVLTAFVATIGWRLWQYTSSPERLIEKARQALASKRYTACEELCERVLSDHPQFAEALLLAGEAANQQDRLSEALAYYDRVAAEAGDEAAIARCAAGDIWLKIGHASQAETKFREALEIDPPNALAHDRLANLLTLEGRRFESLPHLYELLRQRRASYTLLLLAGDHAQTVEEPEQLARFRAAAPDDAGPLIGLARIQIRRKQFVEAAGMLRKAIVDCPKCIEAHALLGRALLAGPNEDELAQWVAALPPEADEHPDVWTVRGRWAKRRGQTQAAARCFWEALRRDPNHQAATLQLSQALYALGESEMAEGVAARAAALSVFSETLSTLFHHRDDPKALFVVAAQSETLGRLWEAWTWNQTALATLGDVGWARAALARIEPQLNDSLPPTLPRVDVGRRLDLSHYPLPSDLYASKPAPFAQAAPSAAGARFEDVAREAGIEFTYFCGRAPGGHRAFMYQTTGGGIAVLDYDLDGWPDLYFTQGCRWPPAAGQTEYLDAAYRNLGNGRFGEVTQASGLGDDRFSQGATVGDFNNDGFPDLYVANIGVNRLYANNGDGTFSDVSESAGISTDRWTTSCLLADLNADGLPDLYDVNYFQGPGVFERFANVDGMPQSMKPSSFEPAPDDFYLNLGDGRFEEATQAVGMRVGGGNGLGIVAADFAGARRLDLFVANDEDANFFFVNRAPVAGTRPRFDEQAVVAGLAFDGSGKANACMGVAAGDANGDGKLDLFVTNFSDESNTLYLQQDGDAFIDATGPAGLARPSFAMLGFGTQFIDGELDGLPDLVVTNGHVHEFVSPGVSYAMRPQYFRNMGGGRYQERSAEALGSYFQQTYFGRGLVRLDWNRDGRQDFAVSSLETPAALVTNRTDDAGHYLCVQLRGVQSSRDAIGAVVTVTMGQHRQTQWLCAGDGFQASNQRQLIFGLGASTRIETLNIVWPSGLQQEFRDLAADQELILVENSPEISVVPR